MFANEIKDAANKRTHIQMREKLKERGVRQPLHAIIIYKEDFL